jgi:hypothetical protein
MSGAPKLSVCIADANTVSISGHRSTGLYVGDRPVYVAVISPRAAQLADFLAHPAVASHRPAGEVTSAEVAELAGRLMHHADPDVRRLAASALTQHPGGDHG